MTEEEPHSPAAVASDPPPVAPAEETSHDDLPGIPGFEELEPELRARVLARANRSTCDCGCVGHTVATCVAEVEGCAVAERLATAFVDDARAVQLQAPLGARGPGTASSGAPRPAAAKPPTAAPSEETAPGEGAPSSTQPPADAGTSAGEEPANAEGEPS